MKRFLSAVLTAALILSVFAVLPTAAAETSIADGYPAPGEGTEYWNGSDASRAWYDDAIAADPETTAFTIRTAADLAGLSRITAGGVTFAGMTVTLAADIWLNRFTMKGDAEITYGTSFNWTSFMISDFAGTLDGAGHTIYGMYISNSITTGSGLFTSWSGVGTTVKNLTLDGVTVEAKACAGAVVGILAGGGKATPASIGNCHVRGVIETATGMTGGLVGTAANSTKWTGSITDCSVRGTVRITGTPGNGLGYAGGILPMWTENSGSNAASVKNCYVYADVDAGAGMAGGITGSLTTATKCKAYILNCATSGRVSGSLAGGLCGIIRMSGTSPAIQILNSYSVAARTGDVTGVLAGQLDKTKGTLTVSDVSGAEGVAVGTNTNQVDVTVSFPGADALTDGTLLTALNTVASEKGYTLWQKGHHGYPVHVGLQAYVPEHRTVFPDATSVETLGMISGAAARLTTPETSGLRFTMGIRLSWLDQTVEAYTQDGIAPTVEAGILLLPTDYFTTYALDPSAATLLATPAVRRLDFRFSEEELRTTAQEGVALVRASVVNLLPNNYDRRFSALGFLSVTTADGKTIILNAPYVKEHNARCILEIAAAAYDDRPEGVSPYTETQLSTLCHYLDSVVKMEIVDGIPTVLSSDGRYYTSPYTVRDVSDRSFVLVSPRLHAGDGLTVFVDGERLSTRTGEIAVSEGQATVTLPEAPVFTKETTVNLLPADGVVAPLGFPEDLTLRASVTADDPTQTLRWYSSNAAVVGVAGGTLTLLAEGSAYVWAQATDGSRAVSNKILVTVTPAVTRAENQRLTLGATQAPRVDIAAHLADPVGYGNAVIAMWRGGASGAFSLTTDDSLTGYFEAWNAFTRLSGIPVTFYVPGSYDGSRWRGQIEAGGEIGSHTQRHASDATMETWGTAEVWMDFYRSVASIGSAAGQDPVTIAYSYGKAYPSYAAQLFIAARGVTGTPNKGDTTDYLNVNSISKKFTQNFTKMQEELRTLWDADTKIFGASYVGGWTCYHFHSVSVTAYETGDGRTISSATEWLAEMYEQVIRPEVEAGHVWAASFRQIACYGQERDSATLAVTSATADEIRLTLTDKMDDNLFREALTVKVAVDGTWSGVTATQNGKPVHATLNNGIVMVDAVPDAGEILLVRQ